MPQVSVRQKEIGSDCADVQGGVQVLRWRRNLGAHMAPVTVGFFNNKRSHMIQKCADVTWFWPFENKVRLTAGRF